MNNWQRQEDAILDFFQTAAVRSGYTPDEIHRIVFDGSIPLTSVRRGMSNLTAEGKLQKTEVTRKGSYGADVHVWMLAAQGAQMELV